MEWLKKLEDCNIAFYIHILHKEDSVFIKSTNKDEKIICVLDGFSQLLQIFTNNEKVCVKLLLKNQMIASGISNTKQRGYYSILTAITETKIITLPLKALSEKLAKNTGLFSVKTLHNYNKKHEMISILSHRNTKKRIIQLLVILIRQLGEIEERKITIPLHLSHQAIADITGSQRVAVSRVMSGLKEHKIISYSDRSITIYSVTRLIQG